MATTAEGVLKQRGGDSEGGRMIQILADARRCQVAEAIKKARASNCGCPVPTRDSTLRNQVPLESTNLQATIARCALVNATRAEILASQPLRGLSEGARIRIQQQQLADQCATDNRFAEYIGPRAAEVCPPMPTEITNANIPKPSTRCDTLNLLATGKPPNSIVSANR